ncbi:MAG: ComF family protein [Clostridiales Family XIII bacterium]|nr:ComF family protein [Clostridiales Family XIII bacterium]
MKALDGHKGRLAGAAGGASPGMAASGAGGRQGAGGLAGAAAQGAIGGFAAALAQKAIDLMFPPSIYCISCGNLIDATRPYSLCDACVREFKWAVGRTCEKCGRILGDGDAGTLCGACANSSHVYEKGYACLEYGSCREVIHGFKYRGRAYYAESIAQIMHDRMLAAERDFDIILPTPMYKPKERKRGYNQADLAGRIFAGKMGVSYDARLLKRIRNTGPMSGLGGEAREENIKGAFVVERGREGAIRGKRLLIVDDIYTTGSTMDACAKALLDAGAGSVCFIVLAAGAAGAS